MHVPGLKIACPLNPYNARVCSKPLSATRSSDIFEHKLLYGSKGARKEAVGSK